VPRRISPADPAARWTGPDGGKAYFAYSTNYVVDLENAVIMDVEPTVPIRPAETLEARRMIDRVRERFDIQPERLVGDSGYGSSEMSWWLVEEHGIAPEIAVRANSKRTDGAISRDDFACDPASDTCTCPGGRTLQPYRRDFSRPRTPTGDRDGLIRYRATKRDYGG
jgi:hypothetical protein